MDASQLKVKKGENIRKAWERLVLWVESLKVIPNPDITYRISPQGIIIRVNKDALWRHPWRVGADSRVAKVSPGTVNGVVPNIRDGGTLRRIDNRDKTGRLESDKQPPMLTLDLSKASKEGSIFICLKVKPSVSAKGFVIAEDEKTKALSSDTLEIVQTDSNTGPKDGNSYYPLAVLRLAADKKSVEAVFQIAHHNLRYTFQERNATEDELKDDPKTKKIGRGIFYPV